MLDRLFLKYLSKKGKIAYWIGQLALVAIWLYYIFGVTELSRDEAELPLFGGLVLIVLGWGVVCLLIWKKKEEQADTTEKA